MALAPRAVVVHRRSELDELVDRHGTRGQVEFFLRTRGRTLAEVQERHDALADALARTRTAIPVDWRRGEVERADLHRFAFEPEDVVLVVGPDGLVANTAKYVGGQPVVGVDPEPGRNPGVLVRHRAAAVPAVLAAVVAGRARVEQRALVRARLDDGTRLDALNEVFVGHRSHQSARYRLRVPGGAVERQSSSGLVVATGTGATGWAASLARGRADAPPLPAPGAPVLAWFVREAWPSPTTGAGLTAGLLEPGAGLEIAVESDELVVFGDGLEADRLTATWGQSVTLDVSERRLHLVL
ncbi:NAD(+)/NADH kinase [Cellulomonas pakistanensis]|uniref:NAD(+)/NADH kinase n=1 Tax=Cellulomonas pakistanensis TaxID=992287 RepID=UPI001942955C|nr:NAD(+)/NADH kinase [Cellulomonas pakistanensis]